MTDIEPKDEAGKEQLEDEDLEGLAGGVPCGHVTSSLIDSVAGRDNC